MTDIQPNVEAQGMEMSVLVDRRTIDLTGQRFGRLMALSYAGKGSNGALWLCRCDCGGEKVVIGSSLRSGNTASCGCLVGASWRTHGMGSHPAYGSWDNMITRCTNPRHNAWSHYGGRGIAVCDRWRGFAAFWEDVGATWAPGLTLDRIDVNGNYEPSNVRWITQKEQMRNTRANRMCETPWGRITVAEASERSGIHHGTLGNRIRRGWPVDRLFDPVQRKTARTSAYD
jgi:hypothetical protein